MARPVRRGWPRAWAAWALLIGSSGLILIATLTTYGSAGSAALLPPRWCLACGGSWLNDAISNVVLFAPFGFALTMLRVRWWRVMLLSAGLSLGVEYLQSIGVPPLRSASVADVLTNTVGGLVGLWLGRWRRVLFPTSPRTAARLSWGWATGALALLGLTSAALGPRSGPRERPQTAPASRATYGLSPLPFTPRYGWFSGLVDSLTVNGFTLTHRGSGPLIAVVSHVPTTVAMRVVVRGRDEERYELPMGFLHVAHDTLPVAFVGQYDRRASLVVSRRAWDWGLSTPTVRLDDVFSPGTSSDQRPIVLEAWSAPDTLRLTVRSPAGTRTRSVALTPLIGWVLIQPVFKMGEDFDWLAHICWIAVLIVPVGWWGGQSDFRSGRVLGIAALWLGGGIAAMPRWFGVAPVSAGDWVTMAALLAAGAVSGHLAARRSRGSSSEG